MANEIIDLRNNEKNLHQKTSSDISVGTRRYRVDARLGNACNKSPANCTRIGSVSASIIESGKGLSSRNDGSSNDVISSDRIAEINWNCSAQVLNAAS